MKNNLYRISILVLLLLMMVSSVLVSCGNMSLGMGNYTYRHIYVDTRSGGKCINITKWYENDTGVEVQTTDGNGIFFSEGTYIMVEDEGKCPFCDSQKH